MLLLNKKILIDALQISNSIINKKFLADFIFIIHIKNKIMNIFSKNSNAKLLYQVPTDYDKETIFSLDSTMLLDIIKKFDEDIVSLEILNSNQIKISNDKSEFKLFLLNLKHNIDNFDRDNDINYIEIDSNELLDILKSTEFAMSPENYRISLHGLNLKIEEDKLQAIALDGHRMAFSSLILKEKVNKNYDIIIPYKNVYDIIKILQNKKKVFIAFTDKNLFIKTENILFNCSLILGKFPNQTKLLNQEKYDNHLIFNTYQMINSIDRVTTISDKKSKLIKLNLNQQEMTIYGIENGSAKEKIYTNKAFDMEIGFNAKYLHDAISKIENENFIMYFNTSQSAILISSQNNNSLFVIMPISLT